MTSPSVHTNTPPQVAFTLARQSHPFSTDELRQIVERASTLRERLGPDFVQANTDESEAVEEQEEARLSRWCKRATDGDWDLFKKRLMWDGLGLEQAKRAVSPVRFDSLTALPGWTQTLQDCVTEAISGEPISEEQFIEEANPVPFEHLLAHFVKVGRRKLRSAVAGKQEHLTDQAFACLERNLLRSLSLVCAYILHANFIVYRAISFAEKAGTDTINGRADASGATANRHQATDAAYRAFIQTMCGPELKAFFLEYSVLARLVATTVDAWVVNSTLLCNRLNSDWDQLVRIFSSADPGPITHISGGLSDPHCGGVTTHLLTFSTGLRLVYKPKNLGLCSAFQQFMAWCNQQGFAPALRTLQILNRLAYGWVECVTTQACQSEAETQRFYQRAGALLCIVYALNGEDLHHKNVIAAGEHPVLIDLEVLMCPSIKKTQASRGKRLATDVRLSKSVLLTGLLPIWNRNASQEKNPSFANIGGLFGGVSQTYKQHGWTATNTDHMAPTIRTVEREQAENLPTREGKSLNAADYIPDIITGFERMYRLLRSKAAILTEKTGPLSAFADQPVRFLFRSTGVYTTLLRRLRHPKFLREGLDRDIELEVLVRGYVGLAERPPYWPVVEAEIVDLNRLDVPLFKSFTTSQRLLSAEDKDLGACFQTTGYEASQSKLMALDDEDLALQRELIRASFYTLQIENVHEGAKSSGTDESASTRTLSLTSELALQEARQIVKKLQRAGMDTEKGTMAWMSLVFDPPSRRFRLRDAGYNLHDGRCGMALFFTALASVTEEASALRALISSTLRPIMEHVSNLSQTDAKTHKIGGTVGLGSFVYSLTHLGTLLGDASVIEAARMAASHITPEKIATDEDFDIVSGAAGAVLGLLALYRETGDERALDSALQGGQHLLENRKVEPASGLRAWRTLQDQFRTGFAHGAAGIAHALTELYRTTKEDVFLAAALEAFAFERTLFAPDAQNWYPYRAWPTEKGHSPDALWSTWCHGATGIGLARAANLDLFTSEERRDLEAALKTTKSYLFSGVDHVCCGDLGRVYLMEIAAEALGCSSLRDDAREAVGHLLAHAAERGNFALTTDGRELFKPGFLQGLSGVGYTLLEITHPENLPSVPILR